MEVYESMPAQNKISYKNIAFLRDLRTFGGGALIMRDCKVWPSTFIAALLKGLSQQRQRKLGT